MKHRPWHAAFFRDSDSNSPVFSLRDIVVAAVWSWSKAVSAEDIRSSYRKTFLFPFNPDRWIKLSQTANQRQLAATEKILPAKRKRIVKALQKSSHKYVAVEVPDPISVVQLVGTTRTRKRLAREEDSSNVSQFLAEVMDIGKTMDGVAGAEHLLSSLLAWSGKRNMVKAKADLVTGSGEVIYEQPTASSYDPAAAKALQSKTGSLQNLTPGVNRTGAMFSVQELQLNREEARSCTTAAEAGLRKELEGTERREVRAAAAANKAGAVGKDASARLGRVAAQIDSLKSELQKKSQVQNTPSSAKDRRSSDNISKQLKRLQSRHESILAMVNAAMDRKKKTSGTVRNLQSVSRGLRSKIDAAAVTRQRRVEATNTLEPVRAKSSRARRLQAV